MFRSTASLTPTIFFNSPPPQHMEILVPEVESYCLSSSPLSIESHPAFHNSYHLSPTQSLTSFLTPFLTTLLPSFLTPAFPLLISPYSHHIQSLTSFLTPFLATLLPSFLTPAFLSLYHLTHTQLITSFLTPFLTTLLPSFLTQGSYPYTTLLTPSPLHPFSPQN